MSRALLVALLVACPIVADAQPVPSPGLRAVAHDASLTGNGTIASPLKIRTCSTNDGLKYDGATWICTGGPSVTGSGIATRVPVWATASSLGSSSITDNGLGVITASGIGPVTLLINADTDNVTETDVATLLLQQDGTLGKAVFGIDSNNDLVIGNTAGATSDIYFATRSDATTPTAADGKVIIENDGDVGIGDMTPDFDLDVAGTIGVDGTATLSSTVAAAVTTGTNLRIGRDVNAVTDVENGLRFMPFTDGNNYIDSKSFTAGSTIFRVGAGPESGLARQWMSVSNTTGVATMVNAFVANSSVTLNDSGGTTSIEGSTTIGDSAGADSHAILGRTTLTSTDGTTNALTITRTPVASTAVNMGAFRATQAGTFSTAGASGQTRAASFVNTSTESDGTNNFSKYGIVIEASGAADTSVGAYIDVADATTNAAVQTVNGTNYFHTASGSSSFGYAFASALPSKLAVRSTDASRHAVDFEHSPVASTATNLAVLDAANGGTYDATSAAKEARVINAVSNPTRSTGTFDVTGIAGRFDAINAQVNIALLTSNGHNLLNATAGSTAIGYAQGVTIPAKLSVSESVPTTAAPAAGTVIYAQRSGNAYITIGGSDSNGKGVLFTHSANGADGGMFYDDGSTARGFQFRANGNTTRMVIDSGGDVGIGIGSANAAYRLHVRGAGGTSGLVPSGSVIAAFDHTGSNSYIGFANNTHDMGIEFANSTAANDGRILYNASRSLVLRVAGADRTSINSAGLLTHTGAADFDTTLNVDGAATLNSTLAVTGNTAVGLAAPTPIIATSALFPSTTPKMEILTGTSPSAAYNEAVVIRHSGLDASGVTRRLGLLLKLGPEANDTESDKYGGMVYESAATFANSGSLHFVTHDVSRLSISAAGVVAIPGSLAVTGAITENSARVFTVAGNGLTSSTNTINIVGSADFAVGADLLDLSNTVTAPGTLGVVGAVDFDSTLNVDSHATLDTLTLDNDGGSPSGASYGLTINNGHVVQEWSGGAETDGPVYWYRGRNGIWQTGIDTANALRSRDFVSVAVSGTYYCDDAATTNGSPTLTSAAQCGFSPRSVGLPISGAGIPGGTTIAAVAGPTSITLSANATATATGVRALIAGTHVTDVVYAKHRGEQAVTIGIGATPPDGLYRLQVTADDAENALGGIAVRTGNSQTGHAIAVRDPSNTLEWHVTSNGYLHSTGGATIGADGSSGALAAIAGTVLTVERLGDNYLTFKGPNANAKGIVFNRASAAADGYVLYDQAGDRALTIATAGSVRLTVDSAGTATFANDLSVNGESTLRDTLVKGTNTNASATTTSALNLQAGRDGTGALHANQTTADIALNSGLASGGFRHFITSLHGDAPGGAANEIRFYVNSSALAATSTAPGTGNALALTINGGGIATENVTANGSIVLGSASSDTLTVVATPSFDVDTTFTKHVIAAGNDPVLSTCGTGPAIVGSDYAGSVTPGTSPGTTCTLTFANAYASTPACVVTSRDVSTGLLYLSAQSSSAITVTAGGTSMQPFNYVCVGL